MTNIIYCQKLKKKLPAIKFLTLKGEIATRVQNNISQQAWNNWVAKQTMLINEQKLSPLNPEDRILIEKYMIDYLFEDKDIEIKGFVPK